MTEFVLNEVREQFNLDSVALMRLSRGIAEQDGIIDAALMMGTAANQRILAEARLLTDAGAAARGNDLVIGIRAISEERARNALNDALTKLEKPSGSAGADESWKPPQPCWRPQAYA